LHSTILFIVKKLTMDYGLLPLQLYVNISSW